jgi:uncharacterized protein
MASWSKSFRIPNETPHGEGVDRGLILTLERTALKSLGMVAAMMVASLATPLIGPGSVALMMRAGVVSPHQEGKSLSARSVTPEQWGVFLTEVFDEWVRRDVVWVDMV